MQSVSVCIWSYVGDKVRWIFIMPSSPTFPPLYLQLFLDLYGTSFFFLASPVLTYFRNARSNSVQSSKCFILHWLWRKEFSGTGTRDERGQQINESIVKNLPLSRNFVRAGKCGSGRGGVRLKKGIEGHHEINSLYQSCLVQHNALGYCSLSFDQDRYSHTSTTQANAPRLSSGPAPRWSTFDWFQFCPIVNFSSFQFLTDSNFV